MTDLVNYKPTDYPQIPNAEAQYFTKEFRNISTAINSAEQAIVSDESDITTINSTLTSIESAWTAYTPVVTAGTGAITSYTTAGRYKQIGKTVALYVGITITSTGTAGSLALCTLPVALLAGTNPVFCGREDALVGNMLQCRPVSSTAFLIVNYNNSNPFVGSGAVFLISGTYEAA